MDIPALSGDRTHTHEPRIPPATTANTASATSQTNAASQSTSVPSFTAVFAAVAEAAEAAGTTVASTASPTGGPPVPVSQASTTPAAASTTDDSGGSPFGANPWLSDPTGSGPGPVTNYNPIYFATQQTAQTVAQMVGGTVVPMDEITSAPGSPFQQNQPNLMVELPNGGVINPGLVADIYTHGWNQSFVDQQVSNEVAGAAPAGVSVST